MRRTQSGLVAAATLTVVAFATFQASAQETAATGADHDMVVGHLGVGYLGTASLPVDWTDPTVEPAASNVPIVGVRYWLDQGMGIDVGVGLLATSDASEVDGNGQAGPSTLAFALHAGVPLALASSGHFSFQVTPEANFGMASASDNEDPETDASAMLLEVGVRAGAEIQFGFIDIPQLALQGGVGASYSYVSAGIENSDADLDVKYKRHTLGTTLDGDPWDIFVGSITALYYF